MLKLKQLWSVFFLLVYSVSFGHAIIPSHHHSNSDGTHPPVHCETEKDEDHSHIVHDNHLDEGIFDFLGCLIENLHDNLPEDHHTCHETYTLTHQKVNKTSHTSQVIDTPIQSLVVQLTLTKNLVSTAVNLWVEEVTSPLPQLRGPPMQ